MATQIQAAVSMALQKMKFEPVESEVVGGPQELKATEEAVEFVQSLVDEGQSIVVNSDGSVQF